jgi:integrase
MKVKLISPGLWAYDVRYNKKRYRQTFAGLSKDQVQSKCIEKLEELRKQKFGLSELEPSRPVSFDEFSKEYLENYATKKKSEQTYRYHIDRLKKTFGGRNLKSITFDDVEAYQKKREQEVSPSTVNREIACLSGLFSYAVKKGKLAKHPFRGKLDMLKENPKKRRILTDEECSRLLAIVEKSDSPYLKAFVIIALNTGMRPSEILCLRWRDLEFNHHSIWIEQSKTDRGNRQGRKVPMNIEVELAVRGLKRADEFIFFNPDTRDHVKGIKTSFMKACADANIKGVTPYCLRHTVATKLVNELGVDIVTAGRILGHRKIEMTLRYCHPSEATLKRAVDLIGFDWSKKRTLGEEGQAVQPPVSDSERVN